MPQAQNDPFAGMEPVDRLRMILELQDRYPVSPERAAANRRQTGYDALSMIPGPGNAISGYEAVQSGRRAAEAFGRGETGGGALHSGMAVLNALGAVLGLPVGRLARGATRGAANRTNVFVPIEGKKSVKARKMVKQNVPPNEIYTKTKRLVGADGRILEEIPDTGMVIKSQNADRLGDLIDHPKLFSRYPDLKDIPIVRKPRTEPRTGHPVVRTNPETGAFEISSLAKGDLRGDLAKLIQYRIAETTGMPKALRHTNPVPDLDKAAVQAAESGSPYAGQFIRRILEDKNQYVQDIDRFGRMNAKSMLTNKSVGNVNARLASARAKQTPDVIESVYPFSRRNKYLGRSKHQRIPEDQLPIPQENMSPGEVAEFLARWQKYGSGRKPFRDGGAVGAVDGTHGGRQDTRNVMLPEGGYVIPADVVSALGDGNTASGFEKLSKRFPAKKRNGGGVKASVSDGEFIVSPEHITRVGGHDALDNFVRKIRQHNINKLMSLPDPKK